MHEIIHHRKNHHGAKHQGAEIHRLRRHRCGGRPETEENHNDHESAGDGVGDDAEDPWNAEGAPDELGAGGVDGLVGEVCGGEGDGAGAAAPEEDGAGDEVGGVKACDSEGDDIVEGDGGADVDEGEEAGDEGCGGDGDDGDGGLGVQLCFGETSQFGRGNRAKTFHVGFSLGGKEGEMCYLDEISPSWQAPIPRKCPVQS